MTENTLYDLPWANDRFTKLTNVYKRFIEVKNAEVQMVTEKGVHPEVITYDHPAETQLPPLHIDAVFLSGMARVGKALQGDLVNMGCSFLPDKAYKNAKRLTTQKHA